MRYAYLLLALIYAVAALAMLKFRPMPGRLLAKLAAAGAVAGVLVEYWYFRDYWRPPFAFGHWLPVEDAVIGASMVVLAALGYSLFRRPRHAHPPHPHPWLAFMPLGVASFIILTLAGVNSVVATYIGFLGIAAYVVRKRPDLARPALLTGAGFALFAFVVYGLIFGLAFPHFWSQYWLLNHTPYDIKLFGRFPLMEMGWYFTWGVCAGALYPFLAGLSYEQRRQRRA
jgi:hypothetical protein